MSVTPDPNSPEDHVIETEEDWMGDNPISGPSSFSEAVAAEVSAVFFCFQSDNFLSQRPFRNAVLGDATAPVLNASSSTLDNTKASGSTHGHVSDDKIEDTVAPTQALLLLSQSTETSAGTSGIYPPTHHISLTDTCPKLW